MRYAPKSLAQWSQESLAARVSALVSGSPCFCCGAPLFASPVDAACGCTYASGLTCLVCGAGVSDEATVVAPAAFEEREPALVAA